MINKVPVITIDGPSGVGKSTLGKTIAHKLNWSFLESGNIYRSLALLVLKNNIDIVEENIIPLIKKLPLSLFQKKNEIDKIKVFSNIVDHQTISEVSSQLSVYPRIRTILLKKQRLLRCMPGLVAEGRDMGTVVFPDAVIKFFLNANLSIRVKRRMLELQKNGYPISFEKLFIKMKNRDKRDQNRLISPLCVSKNAIILNSTYMTFSEVTQIVMSNIIKKIKI